MKTKLIQNDGITIDNSAIFLPGFSSNKNSKMIVAFLNFSRVAGTTPQHTDIK